MSSSTAKAGRKRPSIAVRELRKKSSEGSSKSAAEHICLSGITLNIGAAAVSRAAVILEWLLHRCDDIIVLTETSGGPGTALLASGLAERGYEIVTTLPSNDRGVLIATLAPVRQRICSTLEVTLPWRTAGVLLDTSPPVAVIGVYVPSRDRSPAKIARKKEFILSFVDALASLPNEIREHLVIAGDYNVVSRRHEPPRKGYFSYEYEMHDSLENLGFAAAHELRPTIGQPHSWIGRTGDGYLYDYVHIGLELRARIDACEYLHVTRQERLSDHAAVAFSCRLGES